MRGASAKIDAVRVASTGAPASLGDVTEPVELIVLVRRDESTSPDIPLSIELHLAGEVDTTLVARLEPPVPVIAATPFRVAVSPERGALPDGRYAAQVRLVTASGRVLASSIPVPLVVRTGR